MSQLFTVSDDDELITGELTNSWFFMLNLESNILPFKS